MKTINRDMAIKKINEMSKEQVSKVLIFMAGMEAEHIIENQNENSIVETQKKEGGEDSE